MEPADFRQAVLQKEGEVETKNTDSQNRPKFEKLDDLLKGSTGKFKPCAFLIPRLDRVIVLRRDCSILEVGWSLWGALYIDLHHRLEWPWNKYVGFWVYCPKGLGLSGVVSVRQILGTVREKEPEALKGKRLWFRWLARGLPVNLNYEREE